MSQIREGNHFFEVGNGIPVHLSKKGTIYSDRLSGTAYINKDNLNQWNVFSDVSVSGGTSNPYVVSGTYSNGTTTLFYNSGGSITITGYYTGATIEVTAKTSNYNLTFADTGKYFTNEGAVGTISFTLPTAVTNLIYSFINQTGNQLNIVANSGDTIRSGLNVTVSGGTISSFDAGSSITLIAINSTEWIATSATDTWVI